MVTGRKTIIPMLIAMNIFAGLPTGSLAYYRENLGNPAAGGELAITPITTEPSLPTAASDSSVIRHVGSGKGEPISSSGRSVPLGVAVYLIVPGKWSASVSPEIEQKEVTWDSQGRDWTIVLEEVARQAGSNVTLDWVSRKAVLTGYDASLPSLRRITEKQTEPQEQSANVPQASPAETPTPVKNSVPPVSLDQSVTDARTSWMTSPGSLSGQLVEWCGISGYQLVWKVRHDLNMTSHAAFTGTFQQALSDLFAGLAQAGHPLRVTFYEGNRVVEVVEE